MEFKYFHKVNSVLYWLRMSENNARVENAVVWIPTLKALCDAHVLKALQKKLMFYLIYLTLNLQGFLVYLPSIPHKNVWKHEIQRKTHVSRACSSGKSNNAKIWIWSMSLGTRPLRITGFIEIPWRPKILTLKSVWQISRDFLY